MKGWVFKNEANFVKWSLSSLKFADWIFSGITKTKPKLFRNGRNRHIMCKYKIRIKHGVYS